MPATAEKSPVQEFVEANVAIANTLIEAGYRAQTRGLNIARVFVEGAGRQQENGRKLLQQFADPSVPWFAPERFQAFVGLLVENQNEALRLGREYIDELNGAAADTRQTVETLVQQSGQARQAQQSLLTQGFAGFRQFTDTLRDQAAKTAGA